MENNENNESVLDEVRQVTEVLTDLKNKQSNLINSINGLTLAEEVAQQKLDAKNKELQDLDENSVRDLTQKINELTALALEKETILSDIQNKISKANKELDSVNNGIDEANNTIKSILNNANSEATKIKEIARIKVTELEAQKSVLESDISALQIERNSVNDLVGTLKSSISTLRAERDSIVSEISTLSEQLKNIRAEITDETQALFEIQRTADVIVLKAKNAEELIAKESELKDSVSSLIQEIENLKADKQAVAVTKAERIAFEKDKYGVRIKSTELDQRIEFIKGVYQDFNVPW